MALCSEPLTETLTETLTEPLTEPLTETLTETLTQHNHLRRLNRLRATFLGAVMRTEKQKHVVSTGMITGKVSYVKRLGKMLHSQTEWPGIFQSFFNLPLHKYDRINSYEHNVILFNNFFCNLYWNSLVYATFKLKSPKPWLLYIIILSINVSLSYCSQKYICTINMIQNDPCDFSTLIGLNLPLFKLRSILQFTCMKSVL